MYLEYKKTWNSNTYFNGIDKVGLTTRSSYFLFFLHYLCKISHGSIWYSLF